MQDLTITNAALTRDFGVTKDSFNLIGYAPGADETQTKAAIDAVLKAQYPQAKAQTNAEFVAEAEGQVNTLLGLIYALLALAVIVALFGIVNTLVLSISEGDRDAAGDRHLKRQVRRIIRYEAVITALIGGILGAILGVVLAFLMSNAIDDFTFDIPFVQLIIVLILSGLVGVAAILPACRAPTSTS